MILSTGPPWRRRFDAEGLNNQRPIFGSPFGWAARCESTSCGVTRKNEFDECEAIGDDDDYDIDFGDDDDDDDDFDDDDDGLNALFGNHAASTRSAALAALVLGAALA